MSGSLLVFDMDGVLVDVSESYREAIRQTAGHFTGQLPPREVVQDYKNQGGWNDDWALSHKLIEDRGVSVARAAVVEYFQSVFLGGNGDGLIRLERWVSRPGLLEALGRRHRLAIFTGRPREEAELTLGRFAAQLTFDPIVAMGEAARPKPAPDGLLQIAAAAPGARLWYIGDTVDDARCSRAAGVPFIGIAARDNPRRGEVAALHREEQAVAVLEDINQLEAVAGI